MASKVKRRPATPAAKKKGTRQGQTDQSAQNQTLGADLPNLYPTHDGSYGRNTLMSLDLKKGQSSVAEIANEKADDEKWESLIKGKGGKKYGMDSNLKKAIGDGHQQVVHDQAGGLPPPPNIPPPSPTNSDFVPTTKPHIPWHNPLFPPFLERPSEERQLPYTQAELPTLNPQAIIGVNNPKRPEYEKIPFYGMAQGKGSVTPFSPGRPDTSRSFNLESGLFSDATVQTPGRKSRPSPQPQQGAGHGGAHGQNPPLGQSPPQNQNQPQGQNPSKDQTRPKEPNQPQAQDPLKNLAQPQGQSQPQQQQVPSSGQRPADQHNQPQKPRPNPPPNQTPNPKRPTPPLSKPKVLKRPPTAKTADPWQQCNLWSVIIALAAALVLPMIFLYSMGAVGPALERMRNGMDTVSSTIPIFSDSTSPLVVPTRINYEKLVKEMQKDMPDSIWVQKDRRGKLQIPQDFWHALRELIKSDDMILMLENARSKSPEISNDHWRAVRSRLEKSGLLGPGSSNTKDMERIVERWLKQHGHTLDAGLSKKDVERIVEDALPGLRQQVLKETENARPGGIPAAEIERLVHNWLKKNGKGGLPKKEVERIVEDALPGPWEKWLKQNEHALQKVVKGVALTKDQFLDLFNEEISGHQREIRQELTTLRDQVRQIESQIPELKDSIAAAGGLNKHEVKTLVDKIVSKAIDGVKLGAVVNGRIQGHEADILANKVNFFGVASGAVIDPTFSSSPWQPQKPPFKSKAWLDRTPYTPLPRIFALAPWVEEGECFCAGPNVKGQGLGTNNISVLLGRQVIPQHLVVEHILPGATLDPGAMPREIELWVYIEEKNLRQEVEVFSKSEFPDTPEEKILNEGFVKIGHFEFDNSPHGHQVQGIRSTQVFKVSDQLTNMNATTGHVVVRALNNYGADHTCFYRLGFYGEVVERPEEQPPKFFGMRW